MSEKKPINWKVHEDCFAINDTKSDCNCLRELYCATEECKFYKPNDTVNLKAIESAITSYTYHFGRNK